MKKLIKKSGGVINLYITDILAFIVLVSGIVHVVINYLKNGQLFVEMYFWDHYTNIYYTANNIPYPNIDVHDGPLMQLLFRLFTFSDSDALQNSMNGRGGWYNCSVYIFVVYILITYLLFCIVVSEFLRKNNIKRYQIVAFSILMSFPFFLVLRTGNCILLANLFVTIGLFLIFSKENNVKLIGMASIAIAAGLKFYPCIYGLILLKKKDWKNAIILLMMGILFFVIPFYMLGTGNSIYDMFNILISFDNGFWAGGANIYYVSLVLLRKFFVINDVVGVIKIVKMLLIVLLTATFFLSKNKWEEAFLLSMFCNIAYINNYFYNCIFFIPVVVLFLVDENKKVDLFFKKNNTCNVFVFICFILLLSIYIGGAIRFVALYIIFIYLVVKNLFFNNFKNIKV